VRETSMLRALRTSRRSLCANLSFIRLLYLNETTIASFRSLMKESVVVVFVAITRSAASFS
jgi:hypothetical protein